MNRAVCHARLRWDGRGYSFFKCRWNYATYIFHIHFGMHSVINEYIPIAAAAAAARRKKREVHKYVPQQVQIEHLK